MKWSKEHIEARMLDAMEGRLSADELNRLRDLLVQYPEFGDFEDELIYLPQVEVLAFDHQYLLKKESFNPSVYQEEEGSDLEKMSIAKLEGLLTNDEAKEFDQLLNLNPQLKQDWSLIQLTKLKADERVVFPEIALLNKENQGVIPWRTYVSFAAAASIVFALWINWPSPSTVNQAHHKSGKQRDPIDQKSEQLQLKDQSMLAIKGTSTIVQKGKITMEDSTIRPEEQLEEPKFVQIPQQEIAINVPQMQTSIKRPEVHSENSTSKQQILMPKASNEILGLREFVLQKGNEKLFGVANPSTSERYASIANYISKSVNVPVHYEQIKNNKEEVTYFRFGMITVERKRSKNN